VLRYSRTILGVAVFVALIGMDSLAARLLVSEHHAAEKSFRTYSPYYHHDLRPNVRVVAHWGDASYPVVTNSLGFRDRTVRTIPPEGKAPRLLFMGDSFTEGSGVPFEKSFVGLVQEALPEREVLDGGVASYSPIIYFRKIQHVLEERGVHFDEVVVFLDISDIEDETEYKFDEDGNVIETAEFARSRARGVSGDFLLEHSAISQALHRFAEQMQVKWYWNRPELLMTLGAASTDRARWTFDDRVFQKFGAEGLRRARHHMDMLLRLLRKHRIPLYLAVYPWPPQIVFDSVESKQVRYWREWAEGAGVPFLDYFPSFLNEPDKARLIHDCFIPGDVHWNETGHQRIAQEFVTFYSRVGTDLPAHQHP
jgi:hypothetical protein